MKIISLLTFLSPFAAAAPANLPSTNIAQRQKSCVTGFTAQQAITSFRETVLTLNTFIDTTPATVTSASAASSQAQSLPPVLNVFASICQLNQPSQTSYSGAIRNLQRLIPTTIRDLTGVENGANEENVSTVNSNTAAIDQVWCCSILPDLDVIFAAAAAEFSLEVDASVPRPATCGSISCLRLS